MTDPGILQKSGFLSPLDFYFAKFMERIARSPSPELALAAALVSRVTREGHICLDLGAQDSFGVPAAQGIPVLPGEARWREKLMESGVVGEPGEPMPLVLDSRGRLYLYRYWEYQEELANSIKGRLEHEKDIVEIEALGRGLGRIFPGAADGTVDWQKVAAFAAARRRFCVIAGGPGTGKTTTVAKILALLVEQSKGRRLRIALVSPTGKGAARIQEAMKKAKESLACDEQVTALLPDRASTIHRLLGPVRGSPYFLYHAQHPLPLDVLIVDEASMVDLALMSKLAQALPPAARFILLGDKDQLSSVEAGAVLGDICDTGRSHPFSTAFCAEIEKATGYRIKGEDAPPGMRDSIVHLTRSYRFGRESGIALAGCSVNEGDADRALRILRKENHADAAWSELPSPKALLRALKDRVKREFHDLFTTGDPREMFRALDRFRILCALREGPFGVKAVNLVVESIFREQGFLRGTEKWYRGRPVLITRNDYALRLYNGDVGIALPDPGAGGDLRVLFQGPDGTLRVFHPLRLPEHETVYALTVHKSQGSEFDRVLLILPDRDSPVLTRELIYTAVTRARREVEVWGREDVFREAVGRRTARLSGLRDALWT